MKNGKTLYFEVMGRKEQFSEKFIKNTKPHRILDQFHCKLKKFAKKQ